MTNQDKNKQNLVKFRYEIELTAKNPSREQKVYIHTKIDEFIDNLPARLFSEVDVNITMFDDKFPKFNEEYYKEGQFLYPDSSAVPVSSDTKSIKFKIDLTYEILPFHLATVVENRSFIYDQINSFINTNANLFSGIVIKFPKFNNDEATALEIEKELIVEKEIKRGINKFKERSDDDRNFDKYLQSLPEYRKKTKPTSVKYIEDYLIKNRSGTLAEIIRGCKAQGFSSKSKDPQCVFYIRLKSLVQSGKITKEDKVYFWNYNEEEED